MYTEGDRSLVATSRQFIIKYHSLHANQTTGDSGPAAANGTRALDGSVPSTSNSTAAADGQAASASRAGLSTGAKAGIGVGVAIAVLGAVFAFFIIRYLKKRKISADDNLSSLTSDPTLLSNTSPAVHSSNLRSGPAMTSETIMTPKTRLRANSPRELENQETTGPAELPVSEHGQSQL